MKAQSEYTELVELITWIDKNTSGLSSPTDDRTMIAIGCFDVAIEHQAAIAVLSNSALYGSAFSLLRVLAESLVRGLWLYSCATESELFRFQRGKLDKSFQTLINEYEEYIETPEGILSNFKKTAWNSLNGFTHTGFHQVSRRHEQIKDRTPITFTDLLKTINILSDMSGKAILTKSALSRLNPQ
jgi:hypothetical protein